MFVGAFAAPSGMNRLRPLAGSRKDWCKCQPEDMTSGIFGRHMKVTWQPRRRITCLAALRNNTMVSAGVSPDIGANTNSHWLGPSSTSTERSGMPIASTTRCNSDSTGSIWS